MRRWPRSSASRSRSARLMRPAPARRRRRRSTGPAGRRLRPARARPARNRPAARPAPRARRGPRDRDAARPRRASKRSGWSGPATTRSPVLSRKASERASAFALALQLDRDERRVLDLDVELLDRSDQHEAAVRLAAQDGREQPHHRRPADRAALVKPGAVAGDPHRAVAAMGRDSTCSTGGSFLSSASRAISARLRPVRSAGGAGMGMQRL